MLNKKLEPSHLRTTAKKLKILNEKLGIITIEDMLNYFPRDYEDLSEIKTLDQFKPGMTSVSRGIISGIKSSITKTGKKIQKTIFTDTAGNRAELVWFNQMYLMEMFLPGSEVLVSGKLTFDYNQKVLKAPDIEFANKKERINMGRIVPIYPATEGMTSKWIREKIINLKNYFSEIKEWLPSEILEKEKMMKRSEAIKELHFPSDEKSLFRARERMTFEEVFLLQLVALLRRKNFQTGEASEIKLDPEVIKKFIEVQDFEPTGAQKIALYQILKDMEKSVPMIRLLQGDVGSGKTFVAVSSAVNVVESGHQVAFMVPTEILARQHFKKIKEQLKDYKNINTEILIGSLSQKEKEERKEKIKSGEINFLVGTHALLTEDVEFKNLALVIIDEQHRFGVEQREKMREHGAPHLLAMSATPIPRSLALVLFGDTDVSVIDEMPLGRKPIVTNLVYPKKQIQALRFIETELEKGRQVFFVYPLINQSEAEMLQDVKAAEDQFISLKEFYKDYEVGLLHGKMKPDKKKKIMEYFASGKIDVLVSTSVIEVGVDVPNATVMVIEGAERFGLAQLHQFRGRVGRGGEKSYCFLFANNGDASKRLTALEKTNNGFELAEVDLKLRGPGQFFGTRQSGMPDLKMANMLDTRLIVKCRKLAEKFLEENDDLEKYPEIKSRIDQFKIKAD